MRPPTMEHEWTADDGERVTIRSIQPEDREIEQEFVRNLSTNSKFLRFFSPIKEISPRWLDRYTRVDYPHEMAFIATIRSEIEELQIGVARYTQGSSEHTAEFAVAVADDWHGRGLGRELLRQLFDVAKGAGFKRIEGDVLRSNNNMIRFCKDLGFAIGPDPGDATVVHVVKSL